jgi:hypothetical protein
MPHFEGAMNHQSAPGKGLCFHRAVGFVIDIPRAELVIGTVRGASPEELAVNPNASPIAFIHAWVELAGAVIAPTTMEAMGMRIVPMKRQSYYEANGITDTTVRSREWVRLVARQHGLDKHLRYHKPIPNGGSFAAILLSEAGVRYRNVDGAALPGEPT